MKTKYAVRDLITGEYIFTTNTDLPNVIAQQAMDYYLKHAGDNLYAVVQLNIDGSETWKSPTGTDIQPITLQLLQDSVKEKMGVTKL